MVGSLSSGVFAASLPGVIRMRWINGLEQFLDFFSEPLKSGLRRRWIHGSGLLIRRFLGLTERIDWFFLVFGHG
jgi:hypothetical protein